MKLLTHSASLALWLAFATVEAQQPAPAPLPTTAAQAPTRDTSYIDAQGTAHVTRLVPIPQTISTEAQRRLSRLPPPRLRSSLSLGQIRWSMNSRRGFRARSVRR